MDEVTLRVGTHEDATEIQINGRTVVKLTGLVVMLHPGLSEAVTAAVLDWARAREQKQ